MSSRKKRRTRTEPAAPAQSAPAGTARGGALSLPAGSSWIILALVVATYFAYAPALRAPFLFDDVPTVVPSGEWKSIPGSPTAGRPIVLATMAANFAANQTLGIDMRENSEAPNKAVSYRLFNLFVHLLTGALLFGVLRRAMREQAIPEDWRAVADPLAAIVCALWLLHPIQSEVVNYVVQRSESLAALFYLGVLYSSQRAWDAAGSSRLRWYATAILSCICGMLCKETIISAPLAVMLYDRAFRLPSWRAILSPGDGRGWLYVSLWTACLVTFVAAESGARGDSAGFNTAMRWYAYLYTQCWVIAHYLRLVVWPNALSIDYGYQTIHGARGIPGLVLLAAFGAATLLAWTRVARFGWFAFLGSMFFMLLAPSSSVVPVLLEVGAERRIYLALAVVLVLAVVAAEWLRRRLAARVPAQRFVLVAAAVALSLAVATGARSRTYNSSEALMRSAVKALPENSRALGLLGWTLFKSPVPQYAAAESALVKALAQDSACPGKCLEYGTLLSNRGRYAEARPLLQRHLDWVPMNVLAGRLLAYDDMKLGDYSGAVSNLEHVVQSEPTESHLVMLGVAYLSAGRRDEAKSTFRYLATFDTSNEDLQRLSERLQDGVDHPEALSNLQDFAFHLARGWL